MGYTTEYDKLKYEIQKKSKELCILIEKFDVIDNEEYLETYKKGTREVYNIISEKILNI